MRVSMARVCRSEVAVYVRGVRKAEEAEAVGCCVISS